MKTQAHVGGQRGRAGWRGAGRRAGFTLIELLVVITITAALISVLLPSLMQVRETTEANVCSQNLKGVMMAESVYMADQKDNLTIASYRPTAFGGAADLTWAGILVGTESLSAPVLYGQTYATHANATPMTQKSPLRCPAGLFDAFSAGTNPASANDPANRRPYITAVSAQWSTPPRGGGSTGKVFPWADVWYSANASSGSYNYPMWRVASDNDINDYTTLPRFGNIRKPSGMVMFFDGNTQVNAVMTNRMSARHINGTATVVVFADGHAKVAESDDLPHSSKNDTQLRALSTDYFWTLTQ